MATRGKKKARKIVVQETTELVNEPEVEIRKPATLSQALTEPAVEVVKPHTRVIKVERKIKRAA